METKPQTLLKLENQKTILRLLLSNKANARVDLAAQSGLSKMTVTNLVNDFIKEGLLEEEKSAASSSSGRPKTILKLGAKSPLVLGIFIKKSNVELSIFTLDFNILKTYQSPSSDDELKAIKEVLSLAIPSLLNRSILGISIVRNCGTIDHNLIEALQKDYPLRIVTKDYADALLLYEVLKAKENMDKTLLVDLGETILSAFYTNNKLYRPNPNIAHASIDYNGLTCHCGKKGCLNAYVSIPVLEKKLRDISKLKIDFPGFCQMQNKKNDARIDWVFKDACEKIGHGIVNAISILGCEQVIISGDGVYLPDKYLSKLEKQIKEEADDAITIKKIGIIESELNKISITPLLQEYLY